MRTSAASLAGSCAAVGARLSNVPTCQAAAVTLAFVVTTGLVDEVFLEVLEEPVVDLADSADNAQMAVAVSAVRFTGPSLARHPGASERPHRQEARPAAKGVPSALLQAFPP